jgi:hypothetical protein
MLTAVIVVFAAACSPIEDSLLPKQTDSGYSTQFPLSVKSYTERIQALLLPVINDSHLVVTRSLDVLKGTVSADDEIAYVEKHEKKVSDAVEKILVLYQPSSCTQHKADTVEALRALNDAYKEYRKALGSGKSEKVEQAVDLIQSETAVLQTCFTVYEN